MKYTVVFKREEMEMPYSLYCESIVGISLEETLLSQGVVEDDVQFIFEGWPRRLSLSDCRRKEKEE